MTRQLLLQLAEISKFSFNEAELVKFEKLLSAEVTRISAIKKTPVRGEVKPFRVAGIGELREDVVKPSLTREQVFKNAPSHNGEYFTVPQVLED